MPSGGLREYWLWGLAPDCPVHADFVQAIGARQLCRLTATLLDGLVSDADWPELTRLAVTMNVYQLYEIISDNLGIGAVHPPPGQPAQQLPVLRFFNIAMVSALEGASVSAAQLLGPVERPAHRLSGFAHSLAGPAHRRMAGTFSAVAGRPAINNVEYGLWPALVANIVAAAAVADRVGQLAIGPVLRDGLVNRYLAVNRTLIGPHLPLFELATVGAHAILVAPTLCFYVGALGELLHPDPGFAGCIEDGTLPDALCDAALLVRLLNDVGPGLLTCPVAVRLELLGRLRAAYARDPASFPDVRALLLSNALPETVLTRLRKDAQHGEFNVALYGARHAHSVPAALDSLGKALEYFATLYAVHALRLSTGLAELSLRLGDSRPLTLVHRFVRFHQDLYAHPYTDASGEYAV
jgi:hypothetical protein